MTRHALLLLAALSVGAILFATERSSTPESLSFQRVSIIDGIALSEFLFKSDSPRFPIVAVFDKLGVLVGVEAGWNSKSEKKVAGMLMRRGNGPTLYETLGKMRIAISAPELVMRAPTVLIVSLAECEPCEQMEAEVALRPGWTSTTTLTLLRVEGGPVR